MSEPKAGDVFLNLMSDRSEQYCIIEGEAEYGLLYSTLSGNKMIYPRVLYGYGFFAIGSGTHLDFKADEDFTEFLSALREAYERA